MDDQQRPVWKTADTDVLDDSILNLVRQMVIAMLGMFAAFVLAELIADRWMDEWTGAGSFVTRGLLFAVLGSISIYLTSARPIRAAIFAQQAAIDAHEAAIQAQSEDHRLVGRLQAAFDMAETDAEAFGVVAQAFDVVGDLPSEMLLADSSRAHLRQVAVAPVSGGPGCGVETPWSCPAVRRSRTMSFESSEDLDACPRLRDRPGGACSALCVPVTVLGTPMGVLHVLGENGSPPGNDQRLGLEATAEQAGMRIGILRAMASSQLQATTDPLTGLLNRRSLEEELTRMRTDGEDYAVAFLDLDHFKQINDTFGHETGDRALRSFARLLRRAVRDGDLVCRYGGEEFVAIFPGVAASAAQPIVERLALDLSEAVKAGDVPPFTVSVGMSDSALASEFTEVIRQADEAMFRAKQEGRDRIVMTDAVSAVMN